MFRYEDEVFGDSEPELDEGEVLSRRKISVGIFKGLLIFVRQKFASTLSETPFTANFLFHTRYNVYL